MGDFFRTAGLTIFCILFLLSFSHAQSYGEDFWDNPNVIWKTYTGTIITAAFAKKMHTQGNYGIVERELSGGRKEIKMVPPKKKAKEIPSNFNWDDPAIVVKDDAGQILPKKMPHLLLRFKSIKWTVDTLSTGEIEVIFDLGSTKEWKSAWTDSNIEYIREWVDKWKGKQLPNFVYKDQNGKLIRSSDLKGKFLVITFWNTKCNACIKEFDQLNKATQAFYDEEVVFLAPNFEQSGTINLFLQKERFDYTILTDARELMDHFGLEYFPTHIIVDKDGTILEINVGGAYNIGEEIGKKLSWLVTSNSD